MKTIYVSGMFAHKWIWDGIDDPEGIFVEQALCEFGPKIEDSVEGVAEYIDGPCRLVGNSMGGLVSLMLAERFPDCEVVMSGVPGFSTGPKTDIIRESKKGALNVARQAADWVFFDKTKITDKVINGIAACFEHNRENVLRLMIQCDKTKAADVLARVTSPVAAIWGDHDLLTPYNGAVPALSEYGVNTFVVGKCGHSPMVESPELFNHYLQAAYRLPLAA